MSMRPIRSIARRLAQSAAAAALVAALAVTLLASPAFAAPQEGDATAGSAFATPIAWLSGLIQGLTDRYGSSPADRPTAAPNDPDRAQGPIGSGFDPNGATGEPPGEGRPGKPGRT